MWVTALIPSLVGLAVSRPPAVTDEVRAPAVVRLHYAAPQACLDAEHFRALVRAEMGRDPFHAQAQTELRAHIQKRPGRYTGALELRVPTRAPRSESHEARSCDALKETLALSAALALDALRLPETVLVKPEPASVALAASAASPAGPVGPKAAPKWRLLMSVGLAAVYGASPGASVGLRLGGGLASARFSLGAELRADLPTGTIVNGASRVSLHMLGGALLPCAEVVGGLSMCAEAFFGISRVSAQGLTDTTPGNLFTVLVGPRVSYRFRFARAPEFRVFLSGLVPLPRQDVTVSSVSVFRMPVVLPHLGLAFRFHRLLGGSP